MAVWRVAELAHPNRPLERGYARVEDRDGKVLVTAAAARDAHRLRLVFKDGKLAATAGDEGELEAAAAGERPRAPAKKTVAGSRSASSKVDQPKLL